MEFYTYKTSSNIKFRWKNRTNDPFYGKGRYFRWELILFGLVFNLQWWKKRPNSISDIDKPY